MIKLYCDICGDEIKQYMFKLDSPEHYAIKSHNDPTQCPDKCEKCKKILMNLNIAKLIKNKIIDMRIDIPKETKTCPHCGKPI